MTERKPPGTSFATWIDQQIQAAAEQGAFDNLRGSGKPLPDRGEHAAEAWVRDYARREGLPPEGLLPTPLRLRKEASRLAETVPGLPTEARVREVVTELNDRIMQWRRLPLGPPIFVPLVDEEQMVSLWRERRASADGRATQPAGVSAETAGRRPRWRGWRRKRTRPGIGP
jgi:Domain of unknown function (DUF1992)